MQTDSSGPRQQEWLPSTICSRFEKTRLAKCDAVAWIHSVLVCCSYKVVVSLAHRHSVENNYDSSQESFRSHRHANRHLPKNSLKMRRMCLADELDHCAEAGH
jgi:hypothetical protein